MPKQTFFNLPEEKRRRIVDCAVGEFAEHGYNMASISRMVAAAGIAKGSFYQYFEDKEDLYAHVIDSEIVRPKLRILEEGKNKFKGLNIARLLCAQCKNLMHEFGHNPRLLKISLDYSRHQYEPAQMRIYGKYKDVDDGFYKNLILNEAELGEIDPGVDENILLGMINGTSQQISDYIVANGYEAVTDEYLDDIFGKVEYILTNGIYNTVKEYAYGKYPDDT